MRPAAWLIAIAAAGCETPAPMRATHPPLHMDVVRERDGVAVYPIERDRPNACSQRWFVAPNKCDERSDAWSCGGGPPPGDWITGVRAEVNGQVIATGAYDTSFGDGAVQLGFDRTGVTLIISSTDDEVAIPLPDIAAPVPVIDDVASNADTTTITWHAAAASAIVELSNQTVGSRCHVTDSAPVKLATPERGALPLVTDVTAFAPSTTIETAFGDAQVWTGAVVSREF